MAGRLRWLGAARLRQTARRFNEQQRILVHHGIHTLMRLDQYTLPIRRVTMMGETKPTVDLGYPTEAYGRIPAFANIEEEAAFWDTHDFTDFQDEWSPVEVTIGPELVERVASRQGLASRGRRRRERRDSSLRSE
jgi:hypothetical protein